VAAATGATLRPRERLHTAAEFRRVFRQGLQLDGPLFLLLSADNRQGHARLGLVTGRRLGGAVRRNRIKRWLREGFRRNKPDAGVDLVLVPKAGLAERSLAEVERELSRRIRRLAVRGAAARRRPGAAAGD